MLQQPQLLPPQSQNKKMIKRIKIQLLQHPIYSITLLSFLHYILCESSKVVTQPLKKLKLPYLVAIKTQEYQDVELQAKGTHGRVEKKEKK